MSKELEAKPEDIANLLYEVYDVPSGICEQIKGMVQRLESIDNANPSEALKELNEIEDRYEMLEIKYVFGNKEEHHISILNFNIIKQALIKADLDKRIAEEYDEVIKEQEKVLEIIKEKPQAELSLIQIGKIKTYEEYLKYTEQWDSYYWEYEYTEEEFDTLKRYCNDR